MAYRSTHSAMILMSSGVKNLIVLAVVLVQLLKVEALMSGALCRMAMVGLMAVMVVDRLIGMEYKMRLAVLAVYMVVVMVEIPHMVSIMVQMQLIMVLAAAMVPTLFMVTPRSAKAAAAIKA